MIVVIRDEVFARDDVDDALLLEILRQGMQLRYRVRTRPSYRRHGDRAVNAWLPQQSPRAQETAVKALEAGLGRDDRQWPAGRSEPRVVIDNRGQPSWPRCFDEDAAYLPLGDDASDLLNQALCLKLENELSDFDFLRRCVLGSWRTTWERALRRKWIVPEQGGGSSEIKRIIEAAVADDPIRRLRMWAMFDNDAKQPGVPDRQAMLTRAACERVGVPYHELERRKIENYVPERAMRAWARALPAKLVDTKAKNKDRDHTRTVADFVDTYWDKPASERHYAELKTHDKFLKKLKLGTVADIWRDDPDISEAELDADGWRDEREQLFLSLFASY